MDFWRNKQAIVTGGSSGLGRALAGELVGRGARVALVARGRTALDATSEQLRALGGDILTLPADVTSREELAGVAEQVAGQWGDVDLVAHCAGRSMRGNALATSAADFRDLWEANFLSSVHVSQAFAESLSRRQGSLVLLGSLASKVAPRYLGAYPSSKHAVAALAQQLRMECGERGTHVLLVCPGPIARVDGARRYREDGPSADVPPAAYEPAGGAKVRRIDPQHLAAKILRACVRRRAELIVPASARLLFALAQLSPRMGDWFLRKFTAE
jgi:NAD(P)-dependent dehydrogenase (short-subunit alcohol dehydrogenase family)